MHHIAIEENVHLLHRNNSKCRHFLAESASFLSCCTQNLLFQNCAIMGPSVGWEKTTMAYLETDLCLAPFFSEKSLFFCQDRLKFALESEYISKSLTADHF